MPHYICYKTTPFKYLIHNHFKIVTFVIVNRPILREQFAQKFKARPHHRQPLAVFDIVIAMLKKRTVILG